jgi:hypothetical protein
VYVAVVSLQRPLFTDSLLSNGSVSHNIINTVALTRIIMIALTCTENNCYLGIALSSLSKHNVSETGCVVAIMYKTGNIPTELGRLGESQLMSPIIEPRYF